MLSRLNALRALAVLMVLIVHSISFEKSVSLEREILMALIRGGQLGVSIFFCLSGFLITRACLKIKVEGVLLYTLKRIAKIVPPFYLSLMIVAVIIQQKTGEAWASVLAQMGRYAFFIEPIFPSPVMWNGGIYWTLPLEVYFYILAPLLILVMISRAKWWIPSVLLLIAVGAVVGEHFYFIPILRGFSQYVYFAWGAAIALLSPQFFRGEAPRYLHLISLSLLFILIGLFGWCDVRYGLVEKGPLDTGQPYRLFFDILLGGVVSGLMLPWPDDPRRFLDRVLAGPALKFIALISYEIYLFHPSLILMIHHLLGRDHAVGSIRLFFLVRVLPPALTIIFSAFVFFLFSKPIHDWVITWGNSSRKLKSPPLAT